MLILTISEKIGSISSVTQIICQHDIVAFWYKLRQFATWGKNREYWGKFFKNRIVQKKANVYHMNMKIISKITELKYARIERGTGEGLAQQLQAPPGILSPMSQVLWCF